MVLTNFFFYFSYPVVHQHGTHPQSTPNWETDWGNDKVAKLVNVYSHFGWKEEHQEYEYLRNLMSYYG